MTLENFTVGAATMVEWFGSGMQCVLPETALQRARICAECPMNQKVKWFDKWPQFAHTLFGVRRTMQERGMVTPMDTRLHVCEVCQCPLKIKIWTPLEVIRNHLPVETMNKLHPNCWITK